MVQVLLNGHFNTVPPSLNIQNPNILNGKSCRGAIDMKGAAAQCLLPSLPFVVLGFLWIHGVMLTAVTGEETGGIGTKAVLDTGSRPTTRSLVKESK